MLSYGWDSMSDSSRRDSGGFQSLLGKARLPKMTKPELPGSMKKGVDQLSGFAKNMFTRVPETRVREPQPIQEARDLGNMGFGMSNVSESDTIYYSEIPEDKIFYQAESDFIEPRRSPSFAQETIEEEPRVETPVEIQEPVVEECIVEMQDFFMEYPEVPVDLRDVELESELEIPETVNLRDLEAEAIEVPEHEAVYVSAEDAPMIIEAVTEDTVEDVPDSRLFDPEPAAPKELHPRSYEEMFGNIPRGASGVVDVCIGTNVDGVIKDVEPKPADPVPVYESTDFMDSVVKSVIKDVSSYSQSVGLREAPSVSQEVERIGSAPVSAGPEEKTFEDVPDVYVPPVKDFEEDAKAVAEPAWDVADDTAEAFVSMASVIRYPYVVAEAPAWDVTEETASAFLGMESNIEYPEPEVPETVIEAPVWDVSEDASESFISMGSVIRFPKAEYTVPAWDVCESVSESYLSLESTIEYPKKVVAALPAWDVNEDTSEAFTSMDSVIRFPKAEYVAPAWNVTEEVSSAYLAMESTIRFPKAEYTVPAWDVADDTAEAFVSMASVITFPKVVAEIPAWDVSESVSESFLSMESTIEYPRAVIEAPVWDVTEEAADSFTAMDSVIRFPKAEYTVPAWDVTVDAAAAFAGYKDLEEEYNKQAIIASLPKTIVAEDLEPIEEERVDDVTAFKYNSTGNFAITGTDIGDTLVDVKGNKDYNQDSMNVPVEKISTIHQTRFVFKDGKLQKVVESLDLSKIEDATVSGEFAAAPEVMDESIRAPLAVEDESEEAVAEETVMAIEAPEAILSVEAPEAVLAVEAPEQVLAVSAAPEVIQLPAAAPVYALPEPKILSKTVNGVRFTFGRSNNSSGSVRFSF